MSNSINVIITLIIATACLFNAYAKAAEFFRSDIILTQKNTGSKVGAFMGKCSVGLESHDLLKITCSGSEKSDVANYLIHGASQLSYEIESSTTKLGLKESIGQSSAIYSDAMVNLRDSRTIYIYFHFLSQNQ